MNIPIRMYKGTPGTTSSNIYNVAVGSKIILKNILLCNNGSVDSNITIQIYGKGETASNAISIIKDYTVKSNDTVVIDLSTILESEDVLIASQNSAGNIHLYVSGVEVK